MTEVVSIVAMPEGMNSAPVLRVPRLTAGYAGKAITRIENLHIRAGEAALLAGRSGSGKTTALLAIAGLAQRIEGEISVDDTLVSSLSPRARDRHRGQHIGLVFQDLHLAYGLTALENMLLAPFSAGHKRDVVRATDLLKGLGLEARIRARAETLSRGEAQRVAIARAMLIEPSLILADEPTASLDDEACEKVLDLLLGATRETGAALLIATHDSRVKSRISNVVVAEPA